jgi:hypothetical protein
MVTEKLTKAYLWRSDSPPAPKHEVFVNFLRGLRFVEKERGVALASDMGFRKLDQFHAWIKQAVGMARGLEALAPALAKNRENAEYPWPHEAPVEYPAGYDFALWRSLESSSTGRQFLRCIRIAVDRFPAYA